ncbi:MAG TPA: hypothetical protein ENL23_01285 [Candidatus Acetothermia bacterium]|nr:hypothetical protein [Candidatus Acetothermia bacterium]
MEKKFAILGVLVLLLATTAAVAGGVDTAFYPAGDYTLVVLTNTTGTAVTGLHVEFDQEVTITNKIEIGGYLPATGELTGTTFDFAGGSLVAAGGVELDWQPADAKPVLISWLSDGKPVGAPYFTSLDVFGLLLGKGIVAMREADPEGLNALFTQFFADNKDYFDQVSQSLGMPLEQSLMPIIMAAPAEGIANFFSTLVGMLGATSLDDVLHGDVNFSALMGLLGQ